MYTIVWDEKAASSLDKLDHLVAKRIATSVREMEAGFDNKDVIKLHGSSDFRLRVGDYRVIFAIEGTTIMVLKVGHRKNIYER